MATLFPHSMQDRYQHFMEQFNKRRTLHEFCNQQESTKQRHYLKFPPCDSGSKSKNSLVSKRQRKFETETLHFPEIKTGNSPLNTTLRVSDGNKSDTFPRIPQPINRPDKGVRIDRDNKGKRHRWRTRRCKAKNLLGKPKNLVTHYAIGTTDFEHWLMYGNEEEKFHEDGGYALLGRIDKVFNEKNSNQAMDSPRSTTKGVVCSSDIKIKLTDTLQKKYTDRVKDGFSSSNNNDVKPADSATRSDEFCKHCMYKKKQQKHNRSRNCADETTKQSQFKSDSMNYSEELKEQRLSSLRDENNEHSSNETKKCQQIYFYNGLRISPKEKSKQEPRQKDNPSTSDATITASDVSTLSSSNRLTILQEEQQQDPSSASKLTYTIVIPCCTQDADDNTHHACCSGGVISKCKQNHESDEKNSLTPSKELHVILPCTNTTHVEKTASVSRKDDSRGNAVVPPTYKPVLALEKLESGDQKETSSERCSFWLTKQCPS